MGSGGRAHEDGLGFKEMGPLQHPWTSKTRPTLDLRDYPEHRLG